MSYDRSRPLGREAIAAVALATLVGLLARFYALGFRMAHWDEARVGIRILQYMGQPILDYVQTGVYQYDSVVHGPFLFHVNRRLFSWFGPSDFVMRTPVALVGTLLPLAALLFRERLRDAEVACLAFLLAANPVLLYYSRFMRSDVLLAAFALFAVGFAVRALDTGKGRYAVVAAVSIALAATTKEFVIVDIVAWGCALVLLLDRRLLLARTSSDWASVFAAPFVRPVGSFHRYVLNREGASARLGGFAHWLRAGAREHAHGLRTLVGSVVALFAVLVAFYAPRPDLWQALDEPGRWPDVLGAATIGSWNEFMSMWVAGGQQDHAYLPYLIDYLNVVVAGALALAAFSLVGFVVDRYTGERDAVAFCFYWGVLAALVYPLATDITPAPWGVVHAVVPLAVPAAVGLGFVVRRGREALARDDRVGVGLAAVVLLLVGAQIGATAVSTSYVNPQDNTPLVQFGQPDDNMKPALAEAEAAIERENADVDMMFYGRHFGSDHPLQRLPVWWYFAAMDANTGYTSDLNAMLTLGDGPPPVVLARERHADELTPALDGYERMGPYAITLDVPNNVVNVYVYIEQPDSGDTTAASAPPALSAPTDPQASTAPTAE